MALVSLSIFKAMEVQKHIEEKFCVHMHINDACSGLTFYFDEEPSTEILNYLEQYFADYETGALSMVLSPNRTNFHLVDGK